MRIINENDNALIHHTKPGTRWTFLTFHPNLDSFLAHSWYTHMKRAWRDVTWRDVIIQCFLTKGSGKESSTNHRQFDWFKSASSKTWLVQKCIIKNLIGSLGIILVILSLDKSRRLRHFSFLMTFNFKLINRLILPIKF